MHDEKAGFGPLFCCRFGITRALFLLRPGEGGAQRRMRVRAKPRAVETTRASPRTLTPTPAPRPGPRLLRGRSKPRAPVARKRCLVAPAGEGL
ncbi:hypothetical protein BI317_09245 [Xanthomonas hortorum pv. gardneri]|nr:hypothetical protein BI317_09245 [Xanthomonas hortorum pv. gardneri]